MKRIIFILICFLPYIAFSQLNLVKLTVHALDSMAVDSVWVDSSDFSNLKNLTNNLDSLRNEIRDTSQQVFKDSFPNIAADSGLIIRNDSIYSAKARFDSLWLKSRTLIDSLNSLYLQLPDLGDSITERKLIDSLIIDALINSYNIWQTSNDSAFLKNEYADLGIRGTITAGSIIDLSKDTIKRFADTSFYISNNGNDGTGDGSEERPYKTFKKLSTVLNNIYPDYSNNIFIRIDTGTYLMEDIFPYLRKMDNLDNVWVVGKEKILDTINVTHSSGESYFRYFTDSIFTEDIRGKYISKGLGSFGYHTMYPIYKTDGSLILTPADSSAIVGDERYVVELGTKIVLNNNDYYDFDHFYFFNVNFESAANDVYPKFTDFEEIYTVQCSFTHIDGITAADEVSFTGNAIGVLRCYFESSPKSSAKNSLAFFGKLATISNCVFYNPDYETLRLQGIDGATGSTYSIYDCMFYGHNKVIKNNGATIMSIGALYVENADIVFQHAYPNIGFFTEAYNTYMEGRDSIICVDVDYLFQFNGSYDAGRIDFLPNMKIGGYDNFCSDANIENHTLDLNNNTWIDAGTGGSSNIISNKAEIDSLQLGGSIVTGISYGKTLITSEYLDSNYSYETASRTIYIDTTGNDYLGDGSSGSPFKTFKRAVQSIEIIQDGDASITIQFNKGNFTITKEALFLLSLRQFTNNTVLNIYGDTTVLVSGLVHSKNSNDDYVYDVSSPTLSDNAYKNKYITSGTYSYPIIENGTDSILSTFYSSSGDKIIEMSTTLTFEADEYKLSFPVDLMYFKNIRFDLQNNTYEYIFTHSRNLFYSCDFLVNRTFRFEFAAGFNYLQYCQILIDYTSSSGVVFGEKQSISNCLIECLDAKGSFCYINSNMIFSNNAIKNFSYGISPLRNSNISGATTCDLRLINCTNAFTKLGAYPLSISIDNLYLDNTSYLFYFFPYSKGEFTTVLIDNIKNQYTNVFNPSSSVKKYYDLEKGLILNIPDSSVFITDSMNSALGVFDSLNINGTTILRDTLFHTMGGVTDTIIVASGSWYKVINGVNYKIYTQADTSSELATHDYVNYNISAFKYYSRKDSAWIDNINMDKEYSSDLFNFYSLNLKKDIVNALVTNQSEANIGFIGDSYVYWYFFALKEWIVKQYGFAGGYESFVRNTDYSDYNYEYYEVTDWVYSKVLDDPYIITNRYITTSTADAQVNLSAKKFNGVRIAYVQSSGAGEFSIQLGDAGTPVTIDTDGSDSLAWYNFNISPDTTCSFPNDTIIIKRVSGTLKLLGFDFYYNNYTNEKYKPIRVHLIEDPACKYYEFMRDNNRQASNNFYDTLDMSWLGTIFLENEIGDSLYNWSTEAIDSLRLYTDSLMDICLITPQQTKYGSYANQYEYYFKSAIDNKVGLINLYNKLGSMGEQEKYNMTTDSIHLSGDGFYLPMMGIINYLFNAYNIIDELKTKKINIARDSFVYNYNTGSLGLNVDEPENGVLHIYKNASQGAIGSPVLSNSGLHVEDVNSNMYMDGNSIYFDNSSMIGTTTNTSLDFGANGAFIMRVSTNGNVGLGTNTPTKKLDVNGNVKISGDTLFLGLDTIVGAFQVLTPAGDVIKFAIGGDTILKIIEDTTFINNNLKADNFFKDDDSLATVSFITSSFLRKDGSTELIGDWNAGDYNITIGDTAKLDGVTQINKKLEFYSLIDSSDDGQTKDTCIIDFSLYNSLWYKCKSDTIKIDVQNIPSGKTQTNIAYFYYNDSTVVEFLDSTEWRYINSSFSLDSATIDFINIATNPFDSKVTINVSTLTDL